MGFMQRGASGILVTSRRRGDCGTYFRNAQGTNAKANAKKKLLDVYPVLTSNPSSSEGGPQKKRKRFSVAQIPRIHSS